MSLIERHSLIARPVETVFDLVHDVAAYPTRFPWCRSAATAEISDVEVLATLHLSYAGFQTSLRTRNRFQRPHRIDLVLDEGPFSELRGSWTFLPLSEAGCKVSLLLDFQFAGRWVGSALAIGFQSLADRLVEDFARASRGLPVR